MSYSFEGIPGSSQADELVQRQLRSLLQQLSWSYVALWGFNHLTRKLEWEGGHFRVDSKAMTRHGDTEVWNEHLFNSTYKSLSLTPALGSVGMAFAESRSIWMNGPSVHSSAGSKEQAQFLRHAKIETAICIPWSDSVLELGTCEIVAENNDLMASICIFLSENILPALGRATHPGNVSQASLNVSLSSLAPSMMPSAPMRHLSDNFDQQFVLNSLNEQIRRSSSLSSLNTDMFLQQLDEGEGRDQLGSGLDSSVLLTDPRWRSPTIRVDDILQTQIPPLPTARNQALLGNRVQFRSQSATTSSSVSSFEDGISARMSVESPEQNMSLMASSQRSNSHSYTSSSQRRGTPSRSPEIQLGVEDDILNVSQLLGEGEPLDIQKQWRNLYINPSLETSNMSEMNLQQHSSSIPSIDTLLDVRDEPQLQPSSSFKLWRQQTRVRVPVLERKEAASQSLLRRSLAMLEKIHITQRGFIQTDAAVVQSIGQYGRGLASSSSLETLLDIGIAHDPPEKAASSRGQGHGGGGSRITSAAQVHGGQVEAAMMHMMAERRRRRKQKENFTALRKLVPIISKADKASILGDAIVYIKDLEKQIKDLEASSAQMESRYESLQLSHQNLEERNRELEEMVERLNSSQ